ncbi:hypothetical protein [Flammeovirga pacifica]|uniref:Uncharacterized protein n=1 Tax=Flammeovirga pacifica TaxID=915059 RepID=A0A1S1YT29_FLAPC|nr:hypothetical protein [Flammeovirga pacifica]OHX63965.1 hypothetical protein NH26_20355 [Flammeovirga pacifica]
MNSRIKLLLIYFFYLIIHSSFGQEKKINSFTLCGEVHLSKGSQKALIQNFKDQIKKNGKTNLVLEMGFANSILYTNYLIDGNEEPIQRVYGYYAFEGFRSFIQELKVLYDSLPEEQKFVIIGIDFEIRYPFIHVVSNIFQQIETIPKELDNITNKFIEADKNFDSPNTKPPLSEYNYYQEMYTSFVTYESVYKNILPEKDFALLKLLSLKTLRNKSVSNRNNDQEWVENFDDILKYYNISELSNFFGQVGASHLSNTPFTQMIESRSKEYHFDEYLYYSGARIHNDDPFNINYYNIQFDSWEFKFRPLLTKSKQMKFIKKEYFSEFKSMSKKNEILKINGQTVIVNSDPEIYKPLSLQKIK